MKKMISGTLATAVTRCRQKCSVPSFADPSPRTFESGVRMLFISMSLKSSA
jgi:hypothetical protein